MPDPAIPWPEGGLQIPLGIAIPVLMAVGIAIAMSSSPPAPASAAMSRHRRQPGSSRTRRHQDLLGDGAHLRADGRHSPSPRRSRLVSMPRPMRKARSTSSTPLPRPSSGARRLPVHGNDRRCGTRRHRHAIAAIGHGALACRYPAAKHRHRRRAGHGRLAGYRLSRSSK